MHPLRLLTALPLLTLVLGAQTAPGPQLPDRPAAALSKYKGSWAPVVGAEGGAPIVGVAGGQQTLEANAGIAFGVGDHYADGFVTITEVHVTDVPPTTDAEQAVTLSTGIKATAVVFEADLTPDIDLAGAYAVLISPPPGQSPDAPSLASFVHQIGPLPAGKATHLSVVLPKLSQVVEQKWSVLVFVAGRQVRSTGMGEFLPTYLDRIETISLRKRIADRVAKGADAPIAVFRQMPLGLPDGIKAKYQGTTVKASVSINAEGRVVGVKPVGLADTDLADALSRGFGTWLFLPPVKAGAAVPASAIIPLKM
jgi:hypothetical protein